MVKKNKQATITDVAQAAGVSTATVSRLMNKAGPISPETERRVLEAISTLNYKRQRRRSLNGATPGTTSGTATSKRPLAFLWLGKFATNLQHSMTNAVIMGLDRAAREVGRTLNVEHVTELEKTAVRDVIGDAEGAIIRIAYESVMIGQAVKWIDGVPAVLVLGGNGEGRTLIDHVTPDNIEVGILAADYLAEKGCRHVVFASTSPSSSHTAERCLSFVRDAKFRDLPVNVVFHGEGKLCGRLLNELDTLGVAWQMAESRLEMVHRIANIENGAFGLFMPRDLELALLMPQLQVLGVDFHKASVAIGCDNETRFLQELEPVPASINLHVEHVALRAIRRLNYRLAHPNEPRTRVTVMPDIVLPTIRNNP